MLKSIIILTLIVTVFGIGCDSDPLSELPIIPDQANIEIVLDMLGAPGTVF